MDWFSHFHQLCSGKSARELANQPKPKSYAPIKIVFPSLATVDASVGGRPGGGTMFVSKSWSSGVKSHFHDANSKRGGFLMHAKVS
jgi:tyrosyl-DNA phosphodiesterase-1